MPCHKTFSFPESKGERVLRCEEILGTRLAFVTPCSMLLSGIVFLKKEVLSCFLLYFFFILPVSQLSMLAVQYSSTVAPFC